MWRTSGAGEFYIYIPPDYDNNLDICDTPPYSSCNDAYGSSIGRGAFSFAGGTRTTISERVLLNDANSTNGEFELFVDGTSVISISNITVRESDLGRIRGIQMQTFFGGEIFFCDVYYRRSGLIHAPQVLIPRGQRP